MKKNKKWLLIALLFVVGPIVIAMIAFVIVARILDPEEATTRQICETAEVGKPIDVRELQDRFGSKAEEIRIWREGEAKVEINGTSLPLPESYQLLWRGPGKLPLKCYIEVKNGLVTQAHAYRLSQGLP